MNAPPPVLDLVIVGGGLVGASLALSLAPLGLRIALIEAVVPGAGEQHPSFDERTTALANGTVRAFTTLGVWAAMEREAAPIRRIHVSDRGRFGTARIDAAEQGLEALGYVVPNRVIGAALWAGLARASNVTVIAPARVTGSELDGATRAVSYEHAGRTHTLAARLVVAADGIRSLVRDQAGIDAEHLAYEQVALTAVMTTQRFHDYVAYERFTEEGPIAILPLTDGRCGMVWTRRPEAVERLLALSEAGWCPDWIGRRIHAAASGPGATGGPCDGCGSGRPTDDPSR
jgi:2-octaprenyl-6-methoxyphenol hydroxylase